jgi:hypothetical protein
VTLNRASFAELQAVVGGKTGAERILGRGLRWEMGGMAVPSSTAPERSDGTTMRGGTQTTASERNDERGTMRRQPK